MCYRAFISYSQRDGAFARRLHKALEMYQVPRGVGTTGVDEKTRKLGRFFRDDDEMAAATDLGAALRGAIADAESLVVICSPRAAQSRWVNEEIIHFKRTGRADRIFAVIIDGEPNAPPERQSEECFPPALRFAIDAQGNLTAQPTEPLGLNIQREPFNRLVVRLAAGLLRTPFDALWKREQRRSQARIAAFFFNSAIAAIIVGAIATQAMWRPELDAYLSYKRFAHSTSDLRAAAPGASFQDCQPGTSDCPVMVVIPAGRFLMGTANAGRFSDEGPQHYVEVDRFAASRYEITFANWNACVSSGGCEGYTPDRNGLASEALPVINVSWTDAQNYVQWLSDVTGEQYRLLSEAEWEYAARAGGATEYAWGSNPPACDRDAANGASFRPCSGGQQEVGTFRANAFGLYDMHGNVAEWVDGCFQDYDSGVHLPAMLDNNANSDRSCGYQVVRGGAWTDDAPQLRSASRSIGVRTARMANRGFRIARTL